jgi:hypothetical protein
MLLSQAGFSQYIELKERATAAIKQTRTFEKAAQVFIDEIYKSFKESIVLARVFASLRYRDLPIDVRQFVDGLGSAKGVKGLISDKTMVLALMGTNGVNPDWRDRKMSDGHLGIPLASVAFVEAIPMISRLLKELGLGLDWIESDDTEIVRNTVGSMTGMFFVPDALNAKDNKGRDIIAAQSFVRGYNVQSVLGFGGGFLLTDTFAITIIFLREAVERQVAEQLAGMMAFFKNLTNDMVKQEKMFA